MGKVHFSKLKTTSNDVKRRLKKLFYSISSPRIYPLAFQKWRNLFCIREAFLYRHCRGR